MAKIGRARKAELEGSAIVVGTPNRGLDASKTQTQPTRGRGIGVDTLYLLDTNVVSELRKPVPYPAVVAWVAAVPGDRLFLAAITIGEIQTGIEITRRQDPAKAEALELWLDRVVASYGVLPMDAAAFRQWARIKHRKSDTLLEDAMIAATAIVRGLTVVTRNVGDFTHFSVPIFNPFTSEWINRELS